MLSCLLLPAETQMHPKLRAEIYLRTRDRRSYVPDAIPRSYARSMCTDLPARIVPFAAFGSMCTDLPARIVPFAVFRPICTAKWAPGSTLRHILVERHSQGQRVSPGQRVSGRLQADRGRELLLKLKIERLPGFFLAFCKLGLICVQPVLLLFAKLAVR